MYHDLKHATFYRMIMAGWNSGGLPEGSEMYFGQKSIATAGTAVRLVAPGSTPSLRGGVLIRLEDYDTEDDVVYVSTQPVVTNLTGVMVDKFYPVFLEVNSLSDVYVTTALGLDITAGVGVSYMAF